MSTKSQPEWETFIDMMIVQCIDERVRVNIELEHSGVWDQVSGNEKIMNLIRSCTEEGIIFALEYANKYKSNHHD